MTKADTVADLIYKAVHPAGTWTAFRTYLDLYADLRAMDELQEATDPALTAVPDKKPLPAIAPYLPPKAVPALELNDAKGEIKTDDAGKQEHVFTGRGCAEKREIHDRLLAYREANGIGCLAPLAAAAKGVSQEDLRMMLGSAPMPLPKWTAVAAALDKIEKAAPGAGTPETAKQN